MIEKDGVPEYWKFVFAIHTPQYVALAKVDRIAEEYPDNNSLLDPRPSELTYHCNFADVHSASALPVPTLSPMFFIPQVSHIGYCEMKTVCQPILWDVYCRWAPEAVADTPEGGDDVIEPVGKKRRKTGKSTELDDVVKEFPWAADLDFAEGFGPTEESEGGGEIALPIEEMAEELRLDLLMKALDHQRVSCASSMPLEVSDTGGDFRVKELGGDANMAKKGRFYDFIMGGARGFLAEEFCVRRGFQHTMRFDIDYYGQDEAYILARAFCHKMQYAFDWELGHPNGKDEPWTPECWSECIETAEFVAFANRAALTDRQKKAVHKVRGCSRRHPE